MTSPRTTPGTLSRACWRDAPSAAHHLAIRDVKSLSSGQRAQA
jgi:hypothetical protein